jgi:hypothetical protein
VEGFVKWMLAQGFAVGTINRRLCTVKVYAKLATKAGAIATQTHAMIRLVSGYAGKEAKHVDAKRTVTRVGHKKATHTFLTAEQALPTTRRTGKLPVVEFNGTGDSCRAL